MADYAVFKAEMEKSYGGQVYEAFVLDQYHRLYQGQKGIAISDAALVAWEKATQ